MSSIKKIGQPVVFHLKAHSHAIPRAWSWNYLLTFPPHNSQILLQHLQILLAHRSAFVPVFDFFRYTPAESVEILSRHYSSSLLYEMPVPELLEHRYIQHIK